MFRPFSVVRNTVETKTLLALIDYLTNEIFIIGGITFFNQTDSRQKWRFLATVWSKLCPEAVLKNSEIKNKKLGYFVVKAVWPWDVPHCRNIFLKITIGVPGSIFRGQSCTTTTMSERKTVTMKPMKKAVVKVFDHTPIRYLLST